MRERRRVKLAERQLVLARIDRRDAMTRLAGTVAEEARSTALAARSRAMMQSYDAPGAMSVAADLRAQAAMAGALARLAHEAERTRSAAQRRAEGEADALAASETRLKRLEEHADKTRRALAGVKAARDHLAAQSGAPQMARKLLRPGQTGTGTKR